MYIGSRRELIWTLRHRAERAESEQELRVAQARANERARIAREMHDVLAHRISQVSMHAGALAFREDLTPEQVRVSATRDPGQGARGADRPARRARGAPWRGRRTGARAAADVRRPGPAGRGGPRERAQRGVLRPGQRRRRGAGRGRADALPDRAGGDHQRPQARTRQPAHRRARRLARGRARRGDAEPVRVRRAPPRARGWGWSASPSGPSCAAAGSTYAARAPRSSCTAWIPWAA